MTVKELRETLAHLPNQDSKVYLDCEEGILELQRVFLSTTPGCLDTLVLLSDTKGD